MQRVAAKFVLCLLTEEQKTNHHKVGQEIFDRANNDENFLIISRVYGCDVETETQSSQWVSKTSHSPKSTSYSVKYEDAVYSFLVAKVLFTMNFYLVTRLSTKR